ncbi:single-stranded DNA-binding protein [Streptomyces flavofungini]|uniref:Single-stranded DNA-binding protein n=1 Tax=Streptomyces flavofungini TaxID=68200 RepID=A0ABS0XH65_9ACTN|nr:single-stranded DNA-binding protein [Streptomyces flavofungini]MBJ3812316.1 single-stranded DNA-binding protein [Streptomyces flavofungini]GHC88500.1 hypothetical protein GCM10010349_75820 [Streptomyces flavofungini]
MTLSVTHTAGTVTGDVECRFTESGITVCRFRLTDVPTRWDASAQEWRDGAPIMYVCTAWRNLARHAAESLIDGIRVLVTGRLTDVKDGFIFLSVDDLGLSLRQRIAYTEASLPSPAAAAPTRAPDSGPPVPASAPGAPPVWWARQRTGARPRPRTRRSHEGGLLALSSDKPRNKRKGLWARHGEATTDRACLPRAHTSIVRT